ncbi:CD63 antigen, partial [Eufriesea mexicana]
YFQITGVILLVIGIMIHGIYHNYEHFLDNKFLSVPSLLIAIGAIIFLIAFFGCCGAVRENYCMIITFTSLLVIVFILELAGGISGYVLRARASSIIQDKMKDSMKLYENSTEIQYIWNNLQTDFHCCGIKNASDWTSSLNKPVLPSSCCDEVSMNTETDCTLDSKTLHGGCYNKFASVIKSHALQLGGFGIGIAFVQAIGIWFSIFLAKSIKNSYEVV